ncbi:unnamed protein product [Lathyrus sativus]|nr:unnamed protein product [Lathyrus sativus]
MPRKHHWYMLRHPFDLSLLPLYLDHVVGHVLEEENRDALKCTNHGRKIMSQSQPFEQWFQDVMLSRL